MAARNNTKRNSRRKKNSFMPGLIVISIAIVASSYFISKKPATVEAKIATPAVVAAYDSVVVPVPMTSVPNGTRLRDIRFKMVKYPVSQIPKGALTSINGMEDAVTTAILPANLPLFEANLSRTALSSNPVIESIPKGMRAMTIRVDATSSVEGWAGSGAIVDVLLVRKDQTSVIAEKVKILSAERSVSPVQGSSMPNVPSTVTLLVSQEQCLAINTAIPLGKIAFALRSVKDEENWDDTQYNSEQLKGGTVSGSETNAISGYVVVKDQKNKETFALSAGKWIKTDVLPQGFMVASSDKEKVDAKN